MREFCCNPDDSVTQAADTSPTTTVGEESRPQAALWCPDYRPVVGLIIGQSCSSPQAVIAPTHGTRPSHSVARFLRRGEVARDIRLLAAQGALAPRAQEQLGLLMLLVGDQDPEIANAAEATLQALPPQSLSAFLARSDVPAEMRNFFEKRGIEPAPAPAAEADAPLVDASPEPESLALELDGLPPAEPTRPARHRAEISALRRRRMIGDEGRSKIAPFGFATEQIVASRCS